MTLARTFCAGGAPSARRDARPPYETTPRTVNRRTSAPEHIPRARSIDERGSNSPASRQECEQVRMAVPRTSDASRTSSGSTRCSTCGGMPRIAATTDRLLLDEGATNNRATFVGPVAGRIPANSTQLKRQIQFRPQRRSERGRAVARAPRGPHPASERHSGWWKARHHRRRT